ncbi:MAG: class I SAM-dependent methyltransferase [Actinomycetota bacterium]|nr:class I SAM-dependent methyltransferase [Actinomycetota bacterium]
MTLGDLLAEARDLGFLGPGPISSHVDQSRAFAAAVDAARSAGRSAVCSTHEAVTAAAPRSVVDLGSGAGVPGLVLALVWERTAFVLVEAHLRRAAFLVRAIRVLDLTERVTVVAERAESFGQTPSRRGTFDVVTARGFARPAVVAECAAPLLGIGGLLVVSEPPPDTASPGQRWSAEGLAKLGMGRAERAGSAYQFVVMTQEELCPLRFPRRVGVPVKRPLF